VFPAIADWGQEDGRVRVFISSTFEDLKDFRQAVIEGISSLRHQVVSMEYLPAGSAPPLDRVRDEVSRCDAYVGLFARRYGFVPPGYDRSITELEYREAVRRGKDTLVFLLDEDAPWDQQFIDTGWAAERLEALLDELRLTRYCRFFTTKHELRALVSEAISDLERERREKEWEKAQKATAADQSRIAAALDLERVRKAEDARRQREMERQFVAGTLRTVRHFKDRAAELQRLREGIGDAGLRMVLVCGRAGIGKSSLVGKVIHELESGRGAPLTPEGLRVDGVVVASLNEPDYRSPDKIVELICRTLEPESASALRLAWQGKSSLTDGLERLFRQTLTRHRNLIVLDNLESVLSGHCVGEEYAALGQFIEACFQYDHCSLVIATSREAVVLSPETESRAVGLRAEVRLDSGLPPEEARELLRELDSDEKLGIARAPDALLDEAVRRCQRVPRTIETLVGVMRGSPTKTLEVLLADEEAFSALVGNPARELYASLASDADRLVMQVLAAYDHPVPWAAVSYVLPALPVDQILDSFVHRYAASSDRGRFSLHALDQEYAYAQIPDEGDRYCKRIVHQLAAAFYRELWMPRGNGPDDERVPDWKAIQDQWKTIEDIEPQLQEFHHLVRAGLYDLAVSVLAVIEQKLRLWGHYSDLIAAREQLVGRLTPEWARQNLLLLGGAYCETARARKAIPCLEEALERYRAPGEHDGVAAAANSLGMAYTVLGDLIRADQFYSQALELWRLLRDRGGEATGVSNLGDNRIRRGLPQEAALLLNEALAIERDLGRRRVEGIVLGNLGTAHRMLGDTLVALEMHRDALAIAVEVTDRMRQDVHKCSLGRDFMDLGQMDVSLSHLLEALEVAREVGDKERQCLVLGDLGYVCACLGDVEHADLYLEEALSLAREIENPRGHVRVLISRAWRHIVEGAYADAASTGDVAVRAARKSGDQFELSRGLRVAAGGLLHSDNPEAARSYASEALAIGLPTIGYGCAAVLGMVALAQGDREGATSAFGTAMQGCEAQIERVPRFHDALYQLALAHLGLGQGENALATYRQAVEACSASGVVRAALADVQWLRQFASPPSEVAAIARLLDTHNEGDRRA